MGSLAQAIAHIDELINQLESGSLTGTGVAVPPPPAKAPPPAPEPKPTPDPPKVKPAKVKGPKPSAGGGGGGHAAAEGPDLFAKAHLAVARVASVVEHPNSDKLYITTLAIGGGATRQVVAGLRKYISAEELLGSLVVVVLNLKPAKLAGELSEGMLLAASEPEGHSGRVKPLTPDAGSVPGDQVGLGNKDIPDVGSYPKTVKSDHWRKIVSGLAVNNAAACFEGVPLRTNAGQVVAAGFPDASTIS